MSFLRAGTKTKNPPRRKKASKPKPWDFSVSDLDAYKATPEEIAYRKASHRSKHAVSTHLKGPGSARKGKRASPFRNNAQARKIAIMKEVLYDQRQFQDVLEKSDTMMAVVKDLFGDDPRVGRPKDCSALVLEKSDTMMAVVKNLFGDDPRRFAGFPSVTSAPNSDQTDVASSLVKIPPPIQTRSEVISDSMMDASALNDLQQDSDSDMEEEKAAPLSYQPKMNMQRFQQFIESEEKNNTLSTISGQAGMSHLANFSHLRGGNVQSSQLPEQSAMTSQDGTMQTPPRTAADESMEMLRPPKSAMNDTNKVNRTKKVVPKPQPENTSSFSLNDLRKVLENLEDEIAEYERLTGRRPPAERQRQDTFSGYTLAIVDSVTKLTRYLRECELRLQAETTVREQLSQDVLQFRMIVDALTSDIIVTQEEFAQMSSEFKKFKQDTQAEIQRLKAGQTEPARPVSATSVTSMTSVQAEPEAMVTPPKHQQPQQVTVSEAAVPRSLPQEMNPFGDHLKPVSAAVMLSPPVRRSRVTDPETDDSNKRQTSLMDLQDHISSVDSNNSALQEEFAELPGMSTTGQDLSSLPQAISGQPSQPVQTHPPQSTNQTAIQISTTAAATNQSGQPNPTRNMVSVPRPTPLVQSNVGVPFTNSSISQGQQSQLPQTIAGKQVPVTVIQTDQPQSLQRSHMNGVAPETSGPAQAAMSNVDREFLASQIAELNKQHAEAQRRLQGLMIKQNQEENQRAQEEQQMQRQQQQQKKLVDNQQWLLQQQLQYEQQQKLIAMVQQQQEKIQQQRLHQQHQQRLQQQQQQQQQRVQQQQQQSRLPRPNIPQHLVADTSSEGTKTDVLRQSVELPGYRPSQKQTGLPDYPVSPNISPISQRSENVPAVYQSIDSQFQNLSVSAPANRGITVSIPTASMDLSGGSLSPQPQTAR